MWKKWHHAFFEKENATKLFFFKRVKFLKRKKPTTFKLTKFLNQDLKIIVINLLRQLILKHRGFISFFDKLFLKKYRKRVILVQTQCNVCVHILFKVINCLFQKINETFKIRYASLCKKKTFFINCLCVETFLNESFKNVLEFKKNSK